MGDESPHQKLTGAVTAGGLVGALVSFFFLHDSANTSAARLGLSAAFGVLVSISGTAANFWLRSRRMLLDAESERAKREAEREAELRKEWAGLRTALLEDNARLRLQLIECEKEQADTDRRFDELLERYRTLLRNGTGHTPPRGTNTGPGGTGGKR